MKGFARFKVETCCMDVAFVDKMEKWRKGVKFLLFREELFDRTKVAKGIKTKDFAETARAYSTMNLKTNRTVKYWIDEGTEIAGEIEKIWENQRIQFYSTMSETQVTFAEFPIR